MAGLNSVFFIFSDND